MQIVINLIYPAFILSVFNMCYLNKKSFLVSLLSLFQTYFIVKNRSHKDLKKQNEFPLSTLETSYTVSIYDRFQSISLFVSFSW